MLVLIWAAARFVVKPRRGRCRVNGYRQWKDSTSYSAAGSVTSLSSKMSVAKYRRTAFAEQKLQDLEILSAVLGIRYLDPI